MSTDANRIHSIIFVFLDGVGIGPEQGNPLVAADMPFLDAMLDGVRPTANLPLIVTDRAAAFPVDACLGVAGRPQSATGQAALLTGRNVPGELGEHYGPKPNPAVRRVLDQGTVFSTLVGADVSVASANAYPPGFFSGILSGRRLLSAIPYALTAAGLLLHDVEAYTAEQAISGTITGRDWHRHAALGDVPVHEPAAAGCIVGNLTQRARFVFYEHWVTDVLGHRRTLRPAADHFALVDSFLEGLTESLDLSATLVMVGSDHGNVEESDHGRHTRNPALGLMWGAGFAEHAERIKRLTDFRPVIEDLLITPQ
jgi:hypothetical protein